MIGTNDHSFFTCPTCEGVEFMITLRGVVLCAKQSCGWNASEFGLKERLHFYTQFPLDHEEAFIKRFFPGDDIYEVDGITICTDECRVDTTLLDASYREYKIDTNAFIEWVESYNE